MANTDPKKNQKKDDNKKIVPDKELPIDESKAFEDIFDHIDVDDIDPNNTSPEDVPTDTNNTTKEKDDLTRIEGIWPKIQDLLYSAKIFTFKDLATQTPGKIRTLLAKAGGHFKSHDPSTRPEQARLAHTGKRAELDALQEYLDKGKKAKKMQEEVEKTEEKDTEKKKTDTEQINDWDIQEKTKNENKQKQVKTVSVKHTSKDTQSDIKDTAKEKSLPDDEEKKEETQSKSWDTSNDLEIKDISSYIQKTKEEQKIQDTTPRAQDGTDLTTLPDLYAVVPHNKWEHKLVYLKEDAPNTLLDDEKWRTKWSVYTKKWMKIYNVYADFKEHPLLKSKNGELLDARVIDSPDDLTLQLQAIHQGKWWGINFKEPLILKTINNKTPIPLTKKEESSDDTTKPQEENTKPRSVTTDDENTSQEQKPWTDDHNIEESQSWEEKEKTEGTKPRETPIEDNTPPDSTETNSSNTTKENIASDDENSKPWNQEIKETTESSIWNDTDHQEKKEDTEENNEKPWNITTKSTELQNTETSFSENLHDDNDNIVSADSINDTTLNNEENGPENTSNNPSSTDTHDLDNIVISPDLPEAEPEEPNTLPNDVVSENTTTNEETIDTQDNNDKQEGNTEAIPWPWFKNPNEINNTSSTTENINLDNIISEPENQTEDIQPANEDTKIPNSTTENTVSENISETTSSHVETTAQNINPPSPPQTETQAPAHEFHDNDDDEFDDEDEDEEEKAIALKKKIMLIVKIGGATLILILFFILWKIMFSTGDANTKEETLSPTTHVETGTQDIMDTQDTIDTKNTNDTPKVKENTASGIAEKLWLPADTKIDIDTKQEEQTKEDILDNTTPTEKSFTIPELKKKLEAQQKEAQRLLKKAQFVENKSAIKFTMTAKMKAMNTLQEIATNENITADEVQKKATKIDLYLQAATKLLQ